jgi:hypothetical protein
MADQLQSIVQRMVAAGESEDNIATVIKHYKTQAPLAAAPEQPKADPFASLRRTAQGEPASVLWQRAKDNPAATGAAIATMAAGPIAAPMKLLGRLLTMGAAGTAGALPGAIAQGDPSAALKEGAIAAGTQGVGGMASGALKLAGRGMYRAAALPINKFAKYGDLISEGLDNAVPVSKSGLRKAEGLLAERSATKAAALADADTRMGFRTKGVTADAGMNLQREASKLKKAGLDDPMERFDERLMAYEKANGPGMSASELEATKHTLDDVTGGAHKKIRMREALTPEERYGVEMTAAQGRALQEAIPDYKALNRGKMNAEGLRQMIHRRVAPGGSGGNQGLENAMTMLGGVSALPARIAMLPPVLSRGGIAAHGAGQGLEQVTPYLSALIAALRGAQEQDE